MNAIECAQIAVSSASPLFFGCVNRELGWVLVGQRKILEPVNW